jgi:N-acetylglutamate synthase-like GNAT family acetyltransferase
MVTALQREAARRSKRLVCVTISPEFFERMGFEKAPLSVVPPKPEREACPIEGTRVAMAWCPDDNEHERTEDELPKILRSA